nr:hypothetical protein [Tanacetum cinerariifolium]
MCASETVTAPKTHVQPDNLNAQDIPELTTNISEGTLRGAVKDPIEEWSALSVKEQPHATYRDRAAERSL